MCHHLTEAFGNECIQYTSDIWYDSRYLTCLFGQKLHFRCNWYFDWMRGLVIVSWSFRNKVCCVQVWQLTTDGWTGGQAGGRVGRRAGRQAGNMIAWAPKLIWYTNVRQHVYNYIQVIDQRAVYFSLTVNTLLTTKYRLYLTFLLLQIKLFVS